jgi:hypothetical protein
VKWEEFKDKELIKDLIEILTNLIETEDTEKESDYKAEFKGIMYTEKTKKLFEELNEFYKEAMLNFSLLKTLGVNEDPYDMLNQVVSGILDEIDTDFDVTFNPW